MEKPAETGFPIHELLARRWSPRAFLEKSVSLDVLGGLFEAARWAPSCFNEQPARFVVARKEDREAFGRLASCLVDGNAWAKQAPVLVLSVTRLHFTRNDKPNRYAFHDVGLAAENLVIQAESMGLRVHQMAGFDQERAREVLGIPDGHDPVAMIAIGYPGEPDALPDALAERERAPRTRRPLSETVFTGRYGTPLQLKHDKPDPV